MSEPFISQIEAFAFGFPPKGWAFCAGQLLPINQNQALFSLLGTTYGGDGRTTFALPDLRGRVAVGMGNGNGLTPRILGDRIGEEGHTLLVQEMPSHQHNVNAINNGTTGGTNVPGSSVFLSSAYTSQTGNPAVTLYSSDTPTVQTAPTSIANAGASLPHENRAPFLVLNYCIALVGIFPSQN
jgi:microcystin-dependent protein